MKCQRSVSSPHVVISSPGHTEESSMSGTGETLHKICNNFSPSGVSEMTPAKMESVDINLHLVINCGGGLIAKSCLTLCDPMVCSLPGSSVHRILQARILEFISISFSRGSS